MLFSYGFLVDDMASETNDLSLDIEAPSDDPLKKAKQEFARENNLQGAPPFSIVSFRTKDHGSTVSWQCPYVWLVNVNEEDGLDFSLARAITEDGERLVLQAAWKSIKVHDLQSICTAIRADQHEPLFRLRCTVLLLQRVEAQQASSDDSVGSLLEILERNGTVKDFHSRRDLVVNEPQEKIAAQLLLSLFKESNEPEMRLGYKLHHVERSILTAVQGSLGRQVSAHTPDIDVSCCRLTLLLQRDGLLQDAVVKECLGITDGDDYPGEVLDANDC
jgi:hypothetical protein